MPCFARVPSGKGIPTQTETCLVKRDTWGKRSMEGWPDVLKAAVYFFSGGSLLAMLQAMWKHARITKKDDHGYRQDDQTYIHDRYREMFEDERKASLELRRRIAKLEEKVDEAKAAHGEALIESMEERAENSNLKAEIAHLKAGREQ